MAAGKLNKKVTASTLLEVVVSMVIIVTVFGLAMMIYTNVLRLSLSAKKMRAQADLKEILVSAEKGKENTSQSLTVDDFRIEEEVKPYNDSPGLTMIRITAFDQNQQKIAELQKVISNE